MPAISDWATLRSAMQFELRRSDTTFSNQFENFIDRAEHRIYHGVGTPQDPLYSEPLRVDDMVTSTTLAFTSSSASVPSGTLAIRRLTISDDEIGLDYLAPDALQIQNALFSTGDPRYYTVEAGTILLSPSGYTGNVNIVYYSEPTGISSSNTTNAILTAYPTLYLAACLHEGFTSIGNLEKAQAWLSKFRADVSGANATKLAVQHSGGKLTARPRMVIGGW